MKLKVVGGRMNKDPELLTLQKFESAGAICLVDAKEDLLIGIVQCFRQRVQCFLEIVD